MTTTTDTSTTEVQAPDLLNFYLTFGVQYRHTPHPYWKGADPDGWVLIQAPDEHAARRLAVRHFGQHWSMLYDAAHFDEAENRHRYYPKGAIATITPDGSTAGSFIYNAPVPHITESQPEYHGVDANDVVGVRVEGHLLTDPSEFYDVELFHRDCAEEGRGLFRTIHEDDMVRAFELDWNQPAHCPVCEVSLT